MKEGETPIPGYRLIRFLGKGGIGEVWLARGPGGVVVALKFIALGYRQGLMEWRAVQRIKSIRHPNLLPITGVWLLDDHGAVIDDSISEDLADRVTRPIDKVGSTLSLPPVTPHTLVVAMTAAEKSLADLLRECKEQGQAGIPHAQLLRYMHEMAHAIDFLNSPHAELNGKAIQHCDIKPQNMLISGGGVQVCDFGLARLVGDQRTLHQMEGTIEYVAPETIEGKNPTFSTDQYSFAITYYQLRTGNLPFGNDNTIASVLNRHASGKLDFWELNDCEQRVIRRATSVDPNARFPTTQAMVAALEECLRPPPPLPPPTRPGIWRAVVVVLTVTALATGGYFAKKIIWPDAQNGGIVPPPNGDAGVKTPSVLDVLPGFRPVHGTITHEAQGRRYPERIERTAGNNETVVFRYIPAMGGGQPFYIMENKVWNSLFEAFANERPESVKGSEWRMGARAGGKDLGVEQYPKSPVMRVRVEEAAHFAEWLGGEKKQGRLPTMKQWDTAAGFYEKTTWPPGAGPFLLQWEPDKIAVNRAKLGPLPVGSASHDVSAPHQCRDMAGNGKEFTCELQGISGIERRVPIAHPKLTDRVMLRGCSYAEREPLTFSGIGDIGSQDYANPDPWIGFRVVIEP